MSAHPRRLPARQQAAFALVGLMSLGGAAFAPAQAAAPIAVRVQDDFPSQAQVDATRAAATGAAGAVAQVQGQYDAASLELQRMEGLVARAAAQVEQAESTLAERTAHGKLDPVVCAIGAQVAAHSMVPTTSTLPGSTTCGATTPPASGCRVRAVPW